MIEHNIDWNKNLHKIETKLCKNSNLQAGVIYNVPSTND